MLNASEKERERERESVRTTETVERREGKERERQSYERRHSTGGRLERVSERGRQERERERTFRGKRTDTRPVNTRRLLQQRLQSQHECTSGSRGRERDRGVSGSRMAMDDR